MTRAAISPLGRGTPKLTAATVVAILGAVVFLAAGCGQSTSAAATPTPSIGLSPSSLSPSPVASSPAGGPVPAQLLGDWFQPPAVVKDFDGSAVCVLLKLTFTAATYQITHTALGVCGIGGSGDVVVNGTEIDFLNGAGECANTVGRYTWTLTSGLLYFTVISGACRPAIDLQHGWSRTN